MDFNEILFTDPILNNPNFTDNNVNTKKQRRPPNAYILFCLNKRTDLRRQHPELPNIEISRMLGGLWKALDESQRRPYKEKAKELQAEFKRQNPDYRYEKAREKRMAQEAMLQSRNQIQNDFQTNFQVFMNLMNSQQQIQTFENQTYPISQEFHSFNEIFEPN